MTRHRILALPLRYSNNVAIWLLESFSGTDFLSFAKCKYQATNLLQSLWLDNKTKKNYKFLKCIEKRINIHTHQIERTHNQSQPIIILTKWSRCVCAQLNLLQISYAVMTLAISSLVWFGKMEPVKEEKRFFYVHQLFDAEIVDSKRQNRQIQE